MNERQLGILELLIKYPDYKIGDLEKELGLSRRQINYSINQFNSILEDNRLPSIKRNKAGDFFIPSEVVQMIADNTDIDTADIDYLGEGERRDIIIMYISIADHFVSLDHLIDLFYVSKTTMIKDIKNANTFIKQYGLSIEYSREEGYEILGSEINIRVLLNELIILWGDRLDNSKLLSEYLFGKDEQFIHLISTIENELGIKYSSESFKLLVKLLNYTLSRIKSTKVTEKDFFTGQVRATSEYNVIKLFVKDKWMLSESDIEWVSLLFLSSNIYRKSNKIFDEEYLKELVHEMVNKFELKTLITIEKRQEFIERLYAHIRPAIYRIKYNLSLERYNINNLVHEQKYSLVFSLVKDLIKPIEVELKKQFPNEELQLLSLYFGSQIENKNQHIDEVKPKAVTVCANGLITSNMLKKTLENLFPEFVFLSAISEREFYDYEAEYDVVFSTTLLNTKIQQFHVKTIMSNEDQIRLRYNVLKKFDGLNQRESYQDFIKDVLVLIEKHSTIHNKEELVKGLQTLIYTDLRSDSRNTYSKQLNLIEYIDKDSILKVTDELSWEDAIKMSSAPLLEKGFVNENYINRIIDMVSQTNHMYLGESIVIPHVEVRDDVYHEGITFLVSDKAIKFPENKNIHLVIVLAIKDTTKHLKAMSQLLNLSRNDKKISEIILKSSKEIYKIIENI